MSTLTLDSYKKISVDHYTDCHADTIITDRYGDVLFVSMLGFSSTIKIAQAKLKEKKRYTVKFDGRYYDTCTGDYETLTKKSDMSDYMHMIAYAKDRYQMQSNNAEQYTSFIFIRSASELSEELYKRIVKYSSVPILKEWIPYLMACMLNDTCLEVMNTQQYIPPNSNVEPIICYKLYLSQSCLLSYVQEGLSQKAINIDGSNDHSIALDGCNGIDSYLQLFGEGLAKKIQQSFKPKFTPGEDTYSNYLHNVDDYVYYNAGVNLYEAQRSAIQAIVNNMKINKNTFLVGEMGAGI